MGTADVLSGAMALVERGYCIGPQRDQRQGRGGAGCRSRGGGLELARRTAAGDGGSDFKCQNLGRVRGGVSSAEGLPRPQPAGGGSGTIDDPARVMRLRRRL
jgi:hypothetical protein